MCHVVINSVTQQHKLKSLVCPAIDSHSYVQELVHKLKQMHDNSTYIPYKYFYYKHIDVQEHYTVCIQ